MERTVPPHPLREFVRVCGMSLRELSDKVDIPVKTLEGFAEGVIPLSAHDRLSILATLASSGPLIPPSIAPDNVERNTQALQALYEEGLAEAASSQDTQDNNNEGE